MNDSKNSSKGLLVLRYQQSLTKEQIEYLTQAVEPTAKWLGLEPIVLSDGADVRIENGRDALLERVCVALEEIAAQGRMPDVSVAEIAPQALNARPPTWLNTGEAVCKGSWQLGTACGKCPRCEATRVVPPTTEYSGLNTRG